MRAKAYKLFSQALCVLGDFSETNYKALGSAVKLNPLDSSLTTLLFNVCKKAPTVPRVDANGMDYPIRFQMPIIKNYSNEVTKLRTTRITI